MLNILVVTAPFFALIGFGYLAQRARLLPENSVPALNTFVLYFALPCMLFRFTAETPFAQIFNARVFLAYAAGGLATFFTFVFAYRFATLNRLHEGAFAGLAVAWSNWGYMGVTMIPALLGREALPIIIAGGMADLFVTTTVSLGLAGSGSAGGGLKATIVGAVQRVTKNPMMWAVALGALCSGLEWRLPAAPDQLVRLLGSAAVPVALFAIGVSLYRPGVPVLRADVMMITGAKLLLQPYLVAIVAAHVLGLPRLETQVLVLMAALPVAGSAFLFAERGGHDAEAISGAILVSTALAFVSFSALCWAMGVQFGT